MVGQRLWAPWRLEYIERAGDSDECVFCSKPAAGDDDSALIPHRGERCFVILNAFPYANGHLMIAPYEHTAELDALDEETTLELMTLTQLSLRALQSAYGPEGYNIGINVGRIAGAGMADHVHQHVVPRWAGDNNYMPVLADTRVLPQSLTESYRAVREAFESLVGSR